MSSRWCDLKGFALVTNNRRSMPVHLADHLTEGGHIPGIFIINLDANAIRIIDDLILIASAARRDEFADQITFLPFA